MCIYTDFSKRTIIKATEERPRHSEASVLELRDGSLLMAWQCHQKSKWASRDESPSVIALMNSCDQGITWQNERVAAGLPEGCINNYHPTLLRCSDGSISLFFKRYTQLESGKPVLNNFYRIRSYDEGETWTEEEILWKNSMYGPTNHAMKRLSDGAILLPMEGHSGGWCSKDEHLCVIVLRSEDEFETWTQSEEITIPFHGLEEPCISERSDGVLNMVFRTSVGSVFISESTDGGRTWSDPQTTGLRAPASCPCTVSIPNSDAQLVVWNNSLYDPKWQLFGKRTPLTVAVSYDGLKTFHHYFDIETDDNWAFSNPSFTVLSDGLVVLNYWACTLTPEKIFGPLLDLKMATFRVHLK